MVAIILSVIATVLIIFGLIAIRGGMDRRVDSGFDVLAQVSVEQTGWHFILAGFLALCVIWA